MFLPSKSKHKLTKFADEKFCIDSKNMHNLDKVNKKILKCIRYISYKVK